MTADAAEAIKRDISDDTKIVIRASGRSRATSPLRYPGGKAALADIFDKVIGSLDISTPTYVEPYAGGAGAGIVLLLQDRVQTLAINDIDPAVYCFWIAAIHKTEEFIAKILDTPLNVSQWRDQKAIYRAGDETDQLSLGFAFFYLNRTNRSGILNAGPIGGVQQHGNYKIDARFNRDQLAERIRKIGSLRSRIAVTNVDGMSIVRSYASNSDAFIYIDPPYVEMGGSLYLNALTHRDHADLAEVLLLNPDGNWIVTYDPSDFIRRLYSSFAVQAYELSYSAHRRGKKQELIIPSRRVAGLLESA